MSKPVETLLHAVKAAQATLATHIEQDHEQDAGAVINRLLAILDDEKVVRAVRELERP